MMLGKYYQKYDNHKASNIPGAESLGHDSTAVSSRPAAALLVLVQKQPAAMLATLSCLQCRIKREHHRCFLWLCALPGDHF